MIDLKIDNLKIQDNPPLFDRQKYIENVKQDTNIGTNILRVSASDEDADNNGAIRYSLAAPFQRDDLNYFDIQQESGWIFLKRPLDVSRPPTSIHFVRVHFHFLWIYLCTRSMASNSNRNLIGSIIFKQLLKVGIALY